MGSPPRTGGRTSKPIFTRGSLAALSFVTLVEYGFALTFKYLIPGIPSATLSGLCFLMFAMAIVEAFAVYRYLPNSKKPAFDLRMSSTESSQRKA